MRIVALSQHPETDQLLMIMQFADDGTLEMRPCESNDNWYFALSYATKLSSRLAHLHDMGFSHSDLHPGNVVFDRKYTTFLIDVGLSRAAEDTQSTDGVYGRLEYLPPEVFEKKKQCTQKSDIYCLGTLLWQLVVGVPPRGVASSAVSKLDGLREELIPGAPAAFNGVIQSCWHLDPDHRPSAHEVHNQLIVCAAGLAEISPVPKPNMEMEDDILRALAFASVLFSLETQSFIVARRASHQQELEFISNSGSEFMDGASVPYTGSRFHTREALKKTTEYHFQMAFATLGRQSNLGK
jgi:serine/threonine protein kinase